LPHHAANSRTHCSAEATHDKMKNHYFLFNKIHFASPRIEQERPLQRADLRSGRTNK
jgi:hypothetical protein